MLFWIIITIIKIGQILKIVDHDDDDDTNIFKTNLFIFNPDTCVLTLYLTRAIVSNQLKF